MIVSGFMTPADQVVTCSPTDTIRAAMDLMLAKKVGAIVVLVTGKYHVGIVTKTDVLRAFHDFKTLASPVKDIMSKDLPTCDANMSRDQAAKVLERSNHHHALVVDAKQHFLGLISSWDITKECASDGRAWPWNRSEDGRFHMPDEAVLGSSPTTPAHETHMNNARPDVRRSKMGDSFRGYIDQLLDDPNHAYFD